jgi:hypothetical protein
MESMVVGEEREREDEYAEPTRIDSTLGAAVAGRHKLIRSSPASCSELS